MAAPPEFPNTGGGALFELSGGGAGPLGGQAARSQSIVIIGVNHSAQDAATPPPTRPWGRFCAESNGWILNARSALAAGAGAGTPWPAARHEFTVPLGVAPCPPCASAPHRTWNQEPDPSMVWRIGDAPMCGIPQLRGAQGSAIRVSKVRGSVCVRADLWALLRCLDPCELVWAPMCSQGERHSVLGDSVFVGCRGLCPPCWWTPMTWLCLCCAWDGAVQASTMRLELQHHMGCISSISLICNPLVCSGVVRVPIFPQQML